MAVTSVRATYSLDAETMRRIENLARRWDVAKSEVLRRAVRMADEQSAGAERVALLRELQQRANLTPEQVETWVAEVRAERDAWRTPGDEA
ncbi:ribbon-helix-helix protein, CopG family [Luteitalea sp.]|uniref:ribbon-helix-helix protein, CopG family n=1 Tax=Luteitalea sp. TaxID=2004800 RepID=UPI0025C4A9F0|nr:ribbon-helix-helix protein, CopG family [Luteitalea sp.]